MKRALHGAPLCASIERSPFSAESLEVELENAWVKLTAQRRRKAVTLFLTDRAKVAGLNYDYRGQGAEIGCYTHEVTLQDFRADVFWTFEQMRRAA